MSTTPSNQFPARRITPADEAFLRRFRADMKFTYAGPFHTDPLPPLKPIRDFIGRIVAKPPRYTPTSSESYAVGRRLPAAVVTALVAKFGREYNSVLDEVES